MSILLSSGGLPVLAGGLPSTVTQSHFIDFSQEPFTLETALDEGLDGGSVDGNADEVSSSFAQTFTRKNYIEKLVNPDRIRLGVRSTDAKGPGSTNPRMEFDGGTSRADNTDLEFRVVAQVLEMSEGGSELDNEDVVLWQLFDTTAGGDAFQVFVRSGLSASDDGQLRVRYSSTAGGASNPSISIQTLAITAGVHDAVDFLVRVYSDRVEIRLDGNTGTADWTSGGSDPAWSRSGTNNRKVKFGAYLLNAQSSPVVQTSVDIMAGTYDSAVLL